jgi:tetratricopeptide (TPR) repeat protein
MLALGLLLLAALPADAGAAPKVVGITTRSEAARARFLEGRLLADNARAADAEKVFEDALALDPDFALAHAYLGLGRSGAAALEEVDRARALAVAQALPEPERLYIELLWLEKHGDGARALETARALLQVAPEEWRASFELGQLAYDRRDFELAISAYRRSMLLSKELGHSCVGYNNLGYAQAMAGRLDLAALAMQKCSELVPDEPHTLDSLGEVTLAQRRFDLARGHFEQALARSPGFTAAARGLAATLLLDGKTAEAMAAFAAAWKAAPRLDEQVGVAEAWAWAWLTTGASAEARARLNAAQQALKGQPHAEHLEAELLLARGSLALASGDGAAARADAQAALDRLPQGPRAGELELILRRRAYSLRGHAELAVGRPEAAALSLTALEQSLAGGTTTAEGQAAQVRLSGALEAQRGHLAVARARLAGCKLYGLSEFTADERVHPEEPRCLWDRAQLAQRAGDGAAARADLETLARLATRDPVDAWLAFQARAKLAATR